MTFLESVAAQLPYVPNDQQAMVLAALARFCQREPRAASGPTRDRVFVLNGYAGTGKTSLTGALVRALAGAKVPVVLMAPTGRAAKVFGAYAGHPASTIHRKIYRHPGIGGSLAPYGAPQENRLEDAVFIVDEASMIGGAGAGEADTDVLHDLAAYVFSRPGNRLILLGDTAQLPPVGATVSPAMDPDVLRGRLGLSVSRATLTSTVRQGATSGILYNATWLRQAMRRTPLPTPRIFTQGFTDVTVVDAEGLQDAIDTAYGRDGTEQTIVITRSNRRAAEYNAAIRQGILYREERLSPGEMLIVGKNNYHWSTGVKGLDFIANGDVVRVLRVYGTERRDGFDFADVRLALADSPEGPEWDAKLLVDTLAGQEATLGQERMAEFYQSCLARAGGDPAALRRDPYFNALMTKYAYCVTCHKAQGGQWHNVFVDVGYIPDDALGLDLYRWFYTAVTRARTRLYLVNPSQSWL